MPSKTTDLNIIRKKYIEETDVIAKKRRFALFSNPPSLAIGENSYTKVPRNRKNRQTDKVEVEPRNVQIACTLKGKSNSSYFSTFQYKGNLINIEDKYIDPPKLEN